MAVLLEGFYIVVCNKYIGLEVWKIHNIAISNKNWKQLRRLRDDKGFKHYNEIIQFLIVNHEVNVNCIHLSNQTYNEIVAIREKNSCKDNDETIMNMIAVLREYQKEISN